MEMPAPELERSLTLRGAVTLNLLDLFGVGPFLPLPLLLGAMGGPQAMLGWVLGAVLAACDGLVWAELGAMMPEAGGTYAYLGKMFPGQWGRWLSFLFVFQLMVSAPLSVASGCIGLAQYAGFLAPGFFRGGAVVHAVGVGPWRFGVSAGRASWLAVGVVCVAVVLLYRRLARMKWLAVGMLVVVMGTMGWAILTGVMHGSWARVVAFPAGAWKLDHGFFLGLGSAMLIATYDYWGYYNVTFLGGEVREPGRTVPRAVLGSIGIVAVLYLGLNASVLAVMGAPAVIAAGGSLDARRALLSEFMRVAYAGSVGAWLGRLAAVLVMVTAFASVFALLLGYSRIPFAAARDGNFPAAFGRLHTTRGFPVVSLLVLAGVACGFCFFSLGDVIAALVVLRILLQFGLQHVGVMVLRVRRPEMRRPFRMWLYPLPPLLALVGFGFLVVWRAGFGREVALAAVVAVVGTAVYGVRAVVASKASPEA
jgi:APA family basic amino acid/polyamine antiporter